MGEGCHCLPPYSKCSGLEISENWNIDATSSYKVDFFAFDAFDIFGGHFFVEKRTKKKRKRSRICAFYSNCPRR